MAVIETNRSMAREHGATDRLAAIFHMFFGTLVSWNDARMTRKALSKLTDRELDDIGLSRGDIENVR